MSGEERRPNGAGAGQREGGRLEGGAWAIFACHILVMVATDALDVAREGPIEDGYACLVWGPHRAEGGMEWGGER